MSVSKRPSFQFYPKDWLSDSAVRMSSRGAKGLWIDLISLSDQQKHPGRFVRDDGKTPLTDDQILNMAGCCDESGRADLRELEFNEVSKRDENGALYCARVVRDHEMRRIYAENGKKGRKPKDTGYTLPEAPSNPKESERSPAMDYSTHERIPYDASKPIPFGIETDAMETADFERIDAAIGAAWKATKGVGQWRATVAFTPGRRALEERVNEPGWLIEAEAALKQFPLAQTVTQSEFLKPETVEKIRARKFPYYRDTPGSVPSAAVESPKKDSSAPARKQEREKSQRRAAYYVDLLKRWEEVLDKATATTMAELDQKYPNSGLSMLHAMATKDGATDTDLLAYRKVFAECLEVRDGGKSFEQMESRHE